MTASDSYTRRVVIALSVAAIFVIAWKLSDVFILLFGGLILATVLRAMAGGVSRLTTVPERVAIAMVIIGLLMLLSVLTWLIGGRVAQQIEELRSTLPQAIAAASQWLQTSPFGPPLLEMWESAKEGGVPWVRVAFFATVGLGGIVNAVLIAVVGFYLATSPGVYFRGFLRLVPADSRKRVDAALLAAGQGLQRWLFGQMLSMTAIGALTALGLYFLGMPLAVSLGLIAGLLAFVPFFGPIAFAILAVVLAFTQGPTQALHVGLLCFAIQQLEGYVLTPFIQRWAVALPPVLGLVSVVIFGLLFGVMGVLFATPLMVVLMIVVEKLYVEGEGAPA